MKVERIHRHVGMNPNWFQKYENEVIDNSSIKRNSSHLEKPYGWSSISFSTHSSVALYSFKYEPFPLRATWSFETGNAQSQSLIQDVLCHIAVVSVVDRWNRQTFGRNPFPQPLCDFRFIEWGLPCRITTSCILNIPRSLLL